MSDARKADPIPNATTRACVEAGRAMSGRTGISLASTVSSVIDVPATQSSGVERDLAGLDRGDLVLGRVEDLAALGLDGRDVRLDEDVREERHGGRPPGPTTTPAAAMIRAIGRSCTARAMPDDTHSSRASRTTTSGEPRIGMSRNGTSTLPAIAPTVLTASSEPDSLPA